MCLLDFCPRLHLAIVFILSFSLDFIFNLFLHLTLKLGVVPESAELAGWLLLDAGIDRPHLPLGCRLVFHLPHWTLAAQ